MPDSLFPTGPVNSTHDSDLRNRAVAFRASNLGACRSLDIVNQTNLVLAAG